MSRPKLKPKSEKLQWQQVTKEFVASHGEKECPNCEGLGYIPNPDNLSQSTICSCAALSFRRKYLGTGLVRNRVQRIGNRDVNILEFKPLADSDELGASPDDHQREPTDP